MWGPKAVGVAGQREAGGGASGDGSALKAEGDWRADGPAQGFLRVCTGVSLRGPGVTVHHQKGAAGPWGISCSDTVLCIRTSQFKKSYYFVKIFRKRIEQILSEVPGKGPVKKVMTPLSGTFHPPKGPSSTEW